MRTSSTHPLDIAEVVIDEDLSGGEWGMVGLTFCPGKKQPRAATGVWDRDLQLDLDVVREWNAAAVVTLLEEHELASLGVPTLGSEVMDGHMIWYHLPIRDVSVPDDTFEKAWESAGEELRAIIRDGGNVLVHCKGGLGRAGTIAARLLIELGMTNADAVRAVREARPGAIESAQQLSHVRGLAAVPERQPDTSPAAIEDRALGAMLGLAVGDAIGTTLEFTRRDDHPRLTDMVGGGPFRLRPGDWTDDTAMALALMDSLIAKGRLDEADLMTRFTAWMEQGTYSCTGRCFDIGLTTRRAIERWQQSGDPFAGSTNPRSAGNGSLMRLAPAAIRYWNERDLLRRVAAQQSRTTHGAPEAVDACMAFGEVLANAIQGAPRSQLSCVSMTPQSKAIMLAMGGVWRDEPRDLLPSSGYVVHSLEAALWCVGRTGNFADAVLMAANLGDDADTTAAITGQLAGALYGLSGIPQHWLDRLAWRERIEAQARELFAASLAN